MYKSKKKIIFTFLFPSLLGLVVFKVGAMLYSLYISFTEWNLFGAPEFVGLKNCTKSLARRLVLSTWFYYFFQRNQFSSK